MGTAGMVILGEGMEGVIVDNEQEEGRLKKGRWCCLSIRTVLERVIPPHSRKAD